MKLILTMIAACLVTGTSAYAGYPVEGTWGMQFQQNGITFDTTFAIHNNSITVTNVCTMNGESASAHVTSPASYDASTITVLTAQQDQESNNGVNCDVSSTPDTMNYKVQGNSLTLSKPGNPQQFILQRRGN